MVRWIFRLLGMKAAKRAFAGGRGRAPLIDIGLGWALLRDPRVPGSVKLSAFGLGTLIIAALQVVELPVEILIAMLFNVAGIGFDIAWNGVELLAGPILAASILLLRMAPREIVERIRIERGGLEGQPAYSHMRRR
jgi:hypothetical protein